MREHLKRCHSTAFSETTDIIDISFSTIGKQTKLDRFTYSIVCSQARSKAITELVAGVIIKDLRPISFVDEEGFQKYVEPGYCLPSATYLTKLIEHRYEEAITKVQQVLHAANSVSITSDMWTSLVDDAYISLTTHLISDEWKTKSVSSGTLPVTEQHTGGNISSWIEEKLRKFDISMQKIVSFVHDNGSNFFRAGNLLTEKFEWSSESCAGHDLQLCIKAGLEINESQRVVVAARKLVEHFKKSELANTALQKRQQQIVPHDANGCVLQIVQIVRTRWNSVFYMIDCLLQL